MPRARKSAKETARKKEKMDQSIEQEIIPSNDIEKPYH
jgi:hypothetical protein